ncbi:MAG: hybrid sensor histidine kinase/response regulator [Caldilineaceae bacterium]|nr:hybrid sensor histidine kinase/response regulator [Caldilineaceae bacterium]
MNSDEKAIILVVDDNSTNLRLLVDCLREQGHRMLVANSGERALTQLKRVRPDIILLDVMMPGIDGFETCRRVKADPDIADIPIIFMTALNDTFHMLEGFEAGAVDYITKPFQQKEVSARVSTHLLLQRQRCELEQVNAAKDVFISVLGHDLRNPISVILGFSEILADSSSDLTKAQRDRFGAIIRQSALNAQSLLENLLMWSTVTQGRMVYRPVDIDLAAVVDETIALLYYSAMLKEIEVISLLSSGVIIHADPHMLNSTLRNLISNAIKFTPKGGQVVVDAVPQDGLIEVSVRDNGIGMSPKMLDNLLTNELSLSRIGTDGEAGAGLGLFLCRHFVEQSGGRLWAESIRDEGTAFHFTISMPPSGGDDGQQTALSQIL